MLAVANVSGNTDKESAAFANWAMHLSILESTAVQQTTGVPAVSTVKLIDMASAAGQRIYNATAANYASAVQPNLVNCGAHLANFNSYLASGLRLVLPARCDIAENSWSGAGYFTVGSGLYLGAVISDGLSGGYGSQPQATDLIAEYDAAGTTLQRRYVHGPGTDEPIVWYEGSGTTAKNWFYADHLGSIVATANATGASTGIYSYGPYGEPNTTTGPRFRYTGQQLIGELGLYHYKARFYSPSLGRFLQTDPIGYKDDVNLYAYVGNNPGNRIDPTGLASLGAWAYPGASGASSFAVAPQSNVQGTPLGNWIDNSPIHDPPLQRVYPEEFLLGGGLGIARGLGQAAARGIGTIAARSAEAAADAARVAGRTSGAAAELRVGDRVFTDVSTGGTARTLNPNVQSALDRVPQGQRAPWHGHCAEAGCLSQALDAGVSPAGGASRAVNIGNSGRGHGTPKPACSSCRNVLDQFGVKYD